MTSLSRRYVAIGAFLTMLSVIIGAFGAHMLSPYIGEQHMKTYETGVQYQMIHSIGLLLIGILASVWGESRRLLWGARLLVIGIILFSGSLYALSITGLDVFGPITPLGGLAFIIGWIFVVAAAMKRK